ncbi:uncharacterized protein BO96DRAFT_348783 [Aspergillus niger CBS 101883]|uniref:uncharacterized protein n=1 Tax=Aspergillus lacticoffeatus (strain CBS 101883) TaxID=1450533 RepID=UPI000D7FD0AE|nr:uncharacterized protein BO96DRAFT_348783 [Aspergillus niger CBS 101883]PYH51922.1 hypothetical protein BO96DRAFT_348783 [Aspergillus niger CBS 101883]
MKAKRVDNGEMRLAGFERRKISLGERLLLDGAVAKNSSRRRERNGVGWGEKQGPTSEAEIGGEFFFSFEDGWKKSAGEVGTNPISSAPDVAEKCKRVRVSVTRESESFWENRPRLKKDFRAKFHEKQENHEQTECEESKQDRDR